MSRRSATGIRTAAILGVVLCTAIVCSALWQWSLLSGRDTIQELQDLPVNSAVRLIGVVTYVDQPGGRFWPQDETGALPISLDPVQAGIQVGQTVSVDATKTSHYDPSPNPLEQHSWGADIARGTAREDLEAVS